MSRLEFVVPNKAQTVLETLYKDMEPYVLLIEKMIKEEFIIEQIKLEPLANGKKL